MLLVNLTSELSFNKIIQLSPSIAPPMAKAKLEEKITTAFSLHVKEEFL